MEALREHWPFVLGAIILVGGHFYLYVIGGTEWEPISPPLLIAVVVVVAIEAVRSYRRRRSDSEEG